MAMRLTCPACGATFGPEPADAGRVVPCPGCGSRIQMPPARAAVKPVAKRRATVAKAAPRAAGSSGTWLVALAVLFGTSVIGLGLGAGGVFVYNRLQPREQPQVAEKPPAPAPPVQEPPNVNPPKVESPPVTPPDPKAPPKRPPTVAQTIPGLKLYLPCDASAGGKVTELVSGKQVGTGVGLELTDGPRGKPALRLTHENKNAHRYALDVSELKTALALPAGRPFTLAFWARRSFTEGQNGFGVDLIEAHNDLNEEKNRLLRARLARTTPSAATATLIDGPDRVNPALARTLYPSHVVTEPAKWNHFALVRDEQGTVRWLVNGTDGVRPGAFAGELRYDVIGLVRSADGKTVVDLADLCFYDRALTDAEFAALTGLKPSPAPEPPALALGKAPAPGAVPAATDIRGLRFYLPCDKLDGARLTEAVSGKLVGKGGLPQVIDDGPRGRAVRVTAGVGGPEGINLSAHVDELAIEEGKPFTLAMWVRTDDWDTAGARFLEGYSLGADRFRFHSISRTPKGIGVLYHQGTPGGKANPQNQYASGGRDVPPVNGWIHLAVTRDEKGVVRLAINGTVEVVTPGTYSTDTRVKTFALGFQQTGRFVFDLDEFCLFDRVLTNEELGWLAGGKPAPKAVVVIEPPKNPMPRPPLELAPPPRAVVAVAVAPIDPVVPVKSAVPAGVDPKGLKVYLPFEELNEGAVREGVTGRFLGECAGVELVAGPRGKAARIATDRADGGQGTSKLDFADLAEQVAVPAGKPFTLALWVREEVRDPMARGGSSVLRLSARPNREYDRALQIGFGANGVVHFSARSTPDRLDPKRESAVQWATVGNAARWQHLAIVRDEKNAVRAYLNGKHVPPTGKPDPVWDGPLGYDRFLFGDPDQLRTVLGVDEFCLFDRVLTADELKKLSEPSK